MNVDWEFVAKVARFASGDPQGMVTPTGLQARADEAAGHVIDATGMVPLSDLPAAEWVSRGEWIDANVATMRSLLEPVIEKASVPKGASPLVNTIGMGAVALEMGGLLGMLSRRVLGQLEIDLLDESRVPRLLMVGPNLESAPVRMNVDPERFVTWVLLHEMTHAVQFTSVPWLRTELGSGLKEMLSLAEVRPDPLALFKLRGAELRAVAGAVREGGLLGAVVGPEKRVLMARLQGTMGLVEGHAEWAMDTAGEAAIDDVASLRSAMSERRGGRPPLLKIIDRLLGFDMKLKQYEKGKAFCDTIAEARGNDGLLQAWSSAESAPLTSELDDPELWLSRISV